MVNISEAILLIKQAGATNVKMVPMSGQNINTGNYQIEIMKSGIWEVVVAGMPKVTAESIVAQATSGVICG
jgi:hypothetical protein